MACEAVGPLLRDRHADLTAVTIRAVARLRHSGVRLALVHGPGDAEVAMRLAGLLGGVDLVVAPEPAERTPGRDEVRPCFVLRVCALLGVPPPTCAVIAGHRSLVAAARWAGARAVTVPSDSTPPFDLRGPPDIAPDLWSTLDLLELP